jgi:methyl-accepting chemotaxis protein
MPGVASCCAKQLGENGAFFTCIFSSLAFVHCRLGQKVRLMMKSRIHALFNWFDSTSVGKRLALSFLVVLLLTAGLGVGAIVNLSVMNKNTVVFTEKVLPNIQLTSSTRTQLLEIRDFEVRHAKALDASYMDEYEDRLKVLLAAVQTKSSELNRGVTTTEQRTLVETFESKWQKYLTAQRKVISLGRANSQMDAKDVSDGVAMVAFDDAIAAIDKVNGYFFARGDRAADESHALFKRSRNVAIGLLVSALIIGVVLAVMITRSLQRQLGGEPSVAVAVARAVAAGDLTTVIPHGRHDSTSLMASLRDMQESLCGVVSAVRTGSNSVALASAEIAQGNSDLSQRTEQQAGALEQTAGAMEQLGATVKQNADNAVQANQLAVGASDVAIKGGEVVERVVGTMREINESSRRIADIISVIDGIAFQTNILALNAAVEAARAGEQGRGFAVVATEVRSLAGRSADAAKQIKLLINESVEKVAHGTSLVDEAGATMNDVVNSIKRVADIVGEISTASAEQSAGVAQVCQAVTMLDRATQENAALVEESAAAAEALRAQAEQLVDAVAVFRTSTSVMDAPRTNATSTHHASVKRVAFAA